MSHDSITILAGCGRAISTRRLSPSTAARAARATVAQPGLGIPVRKLIQWGKFHRQIDVTYNDAALKDPCVRECVELHESVHVTHLTPIVKKIHDCDVAAGSDWDKKGNCNEMATRELSEIRSRSECEAYRRSFTCLTLKILDSQSPCSKPPHRDEVQKHRGYEGCEMKGHCKEAGTPEAGIPNA